MGMLLYAVGILSLVLLFDVIGSPKKTTSTDFFLLVIIVILSFGFATIIGKM